MCLTTNIDIISDDVLVARVDGGVLAAIESEKGKSREGSSTVSAQRDKVVLWKFV
jgi:hypothetical protein